MTHDDVAVVERVTAIAFHDLSVTTRPANWPAPEPRSAERAERWIRRLTHMLDHDQPGCWVGEDDSGTVVGAAAALVREGMWGLSTFAVRPGAQTRGLGRRLLASALTSAPEESPGFICSSHDPRAIRLYRLAGFDIHPAMLLWGRLRRSAIPALDHVRDGVAEDVDFLDSVDRATRGHAHGVDHPVMMEEFRLRVVERGSGSRGYAYHQPGGGPYLLAATDRYAGSTALWDAFAACDDEAEADAHNLTSAQAWAIDIGLSAGLELHSHGYLALRAMAPPARPYIPSGHFL
jgi:GNAT superfamily N-acetyltransferase